MKDRAQRQNVPEATLGAQHPTLESLAASCSRQSPRWLTAFSARMVVLIGVLDYATGRDLSLAILYGVLTLSIADDGAGFQPHAAEASAAQGMGLRIMQYRAEALGARLQIKSAPGGGCQVLCSLPLNRPVRA